MRGSKGSWVSGIAIFCALVGAWSLIGAGPALAQTSGTETAAPTPTAETLASGAKQSKKALKKSKEALKKARKALNQAGNALAASARAQTDANQAKQSVARALADINELAVDVAQLRQDVNALRVDVNQAGSDAADALAVANAAAQDATDALTAAQQAGTDAGAAQSTADDALADAAVALSDAADAFAAAQVADTKAEDAADDAADAANAAAAASSAAANAQAAANNAAALASSALSAAQSAQASANQANNRLDATAIVRADAPGPYSTSNNLEYQDAPDGPSVTVTVPQSGMIEVWATTGLGDPADGQVALFRGNTLVSIPGQAGICGTTDLPEALIGSQAGAGTAITVSTPPTPEFYGGCGIPGAAPGSIIFSNQPAGTQTYELRYADCGCDADAANFSDRVLMIAPRP